MNIPIIVFRPQDFLLSSPIEETRKKIEINKKNISYKEVPVTIIYTKYSMEHGAGSLTQALRVLWKMIMDKIHR